MSLGSPNKGSNCVGEDISIQEKQMHLISSMVILKACLFFSFDSVLSWLQSMVEGGWLKMLCKRKFRELKPAEEEKALLKNPFQNHYDMSQIGL